MLKNIIKKSTGSLSVIVAGVLLTAVITTPAQAELVHPKYQRVAGAADNASDVADTRTFNFQWNVLSTAIGYLRGHADYKITESTSVGLGLGAYLYGDSDDDSLDKINNAWNVNVRMNYAFNGHIMQSGWLISPYVGFGHTSTQTSSWNGDTTSTEVDNGVTIGVPFYYQWMWDSGFNMQLGIGPAYSSVDQGGINARGVGLAGGFTIGFAK